MKTKEHWEETKSLLSYHTANKIALNLQEYARSKKLPHRSIRSLDKEATYRYGYYSDSAVIWPDGPSGWAREMTLTEVMGISYDVRDTVILIYDVVLPSSNGDEDDQY